MQCLWQIEACGPSARLLGVEVRERIGLRWFIRDRVTASAAMRERGGERSCRCRIAISTESRAVPTPEQQSPAREEVTVAGSVNLELRPHIVLEGHARSALQGFGNGLGQGRV